MMLAVTAVVYSASKKTVVACELLYLVERMVELTRFGWV